MRNRIPLFKSFVIMFVSSDLLLILYDYNINLTVIRGSGVLAVLQRKEFPETCMGGWGSMITFIDKIEQVALLTPQCPTFICAAMEKAQCCLQ